MARAAGIEMTESRLMREGSRAHFMTKRFDRETGGRKLHLQSLCGIAHYDYNSPGEHSYEQTLQVMDKLRLDHSQKEALLRRAVFNVMARNHDDHTKNISFLMDSSGVWRLAPAYDMTYAFNPDNQWTSRHQMLINGKSEAFSKADIQSLAKRAGVRRPLDIIEQVGGALDKWPQFADDAGLSKSKLRKIQEQFCLLRD